MLLPDHIYIFHELLLLNQLSGNARENAGDGFMEIFGLSCNLRKFLIDPENLSVIVQKCIRYFEFIEQLLLHRSVLSGKINQLIHQHRFINIIRYHHNNEINPKENGYQ